MKLLVIDTATEACSVALQCDEAVYGRFEVCPQQHSQRLLPMIDEVLAEAGIGLNELDYLGFGRGPGSFTGVRIATGMLQGLALGTGLPVVGVSTLAAMAQQAILQQQASQVAVATDARMNEVYFACYADKDALADEVIGEQVVDPSIAAGQLPEGDFVCVGTGWEAYPDVLQNRANSQPVTILYPDARFMLPLALQAISQGRATRVEDIQPVYLRDKVTWKKLPGR